MKTGTLRTPLSSGRLEPGEKNEWGTADYVTTEQLVVKLLPGHLIQRLKITSD